MKKIFVSVILIVFSVGSVKSQIVEPVKWNFSQKKLSNNEVELVFSAEVKKDWQMYTQFFEDGGPMKLSFNFQKSDNYKKIGKVSESPKPISKLDKLFKINVQYVEGKAVFKQRIKVLSKSSFVIKGEIEGQACNDKDGTCVPFYPEFEFKIDVK